MASADQSLVDIVYNISITAYSSVASSTYPNASDDFKITIAAGTGNGQPCDTLSLGSAVI